MPSRTVRLLLVLGLLGATACVSSSAPRRARPAPPPPPMIEVGMTKPEVEATLGRPDSYGGAGEIETWRYERRTSLHRHNGHTVVQFRQGRVAAFEMGLKPGVAPAPPPPPGAAPRPTLRPAPRGGSPHHRPDPGRTQPAPGHVDAPPGHGGGHGPGHGGTPPGHGGTPPGHSGGHAPGHSGAAPGHGGTPPGHGGTPPGQTDREQPRGTAQDGPILCQNHKDCGPGRRCSKRDAHSKMCTGRGKAGAYCRKDNECERGLRCTPGRQKYPTCQ